MSAAASAVPRSFALTRPLRSLKDAYLPQRLLEKLMLTYNYVEMARVTGAMVCETADAARADGFPLLQS